MSYVLEQGLSEQQRKEAREADRKALEQIAAYNGLQIALGRKPQRNPAEDDLLTDAQALELAREEMACTPGIVVQWLQETCCASNLPLDPYRISNGHGLTVPQLLVAVMAGQDFAARQAVHSLRQAFERYISGDVAAYAKNLQDLQRTELGLS